jgi:hypothetical protein
MIGDDTHGRLNPVLVRKRLREVRRRGKTLTLQRPATETG